MYAVPSGSACTHHRAPLPLAGRRCQSAPSQCNTSAPSPAFAPTIQTSSARVPLTDSNAARSLSTTTSQRATGLAGSPPQESRQHDSSNGSGQARVGKQNPSAWH